MVHHSEQIISCAAGLLSTTRFARSGTFGTVFKRTLRGRVARSSHLVAINDELLQLMAEHALHDVHAVRLCYLHNTLDEVVASARSHGVQAS